MLAPPDQQQIKTGNRKSTKADETRYLSSGSGTRCAWASSTIDSCDQNLKAPAPAEKQNGWLTRAPVYPINIYAVVLGGDGEEKCSDVHIIAHIPEIMQVLFAPTALTCGLRDSPPPFGTCLRCQASAPEARQPHRPNRLQAPSAVAASGGEQCTSARGHGDATLYRPERSLIF